jgi:hypothetical protein
VNAPLADAPKETKKGGKKQSDIVNLWRDPSAAGVEPNSGDAWQPTPAYWAGVRARVIAKLLKIANSHSSVESDQPPW